MRFVGVLFQAQFDGVDMVCRFAAEMRVSSWVDGDLDFNDSQCKKRWKVVQPLQSSVPDVYFEHLLFTFFI